MEALTERQSEILQLIRELTEVSGFPPTRAEIAERMGFRSVNAAEQHLRALEKKGAINILSGASRGIRVNDSHSPARPGRLMDLPIVGQVAAGAPILAEENLQGRLQVDPNMFTPRADYLLKVKGLSMRDIGILDGDLLAVHKTNEARTGQVVVARIADEVTVKRFRKTKSGIELIPENPDFETLHVAADAEDFELEGLAVGLIRNTMLM